LTVFTAEIEPGETEIEDPGLRMVHRALPAR
jgi:hypothetical protein